MDSSQERLTQRLEDRNRIIKEYLMVPSGATRLGAGIGISTSELYVSDYRLRLEPDDPVRVQAEINGDIRYEGSPEDMRIMELAHQVGLKAARQI